MIPFRRCRVNPCLSLLLLTIAARGEVEWTASPVPAMTDQLNAVAWTGDEFVAVGKNQQYGDIISSPDGITWKTHGWTTNSSLKAVGWMPGKTLSGKVVLVAGESGTMHHHNGGPWWGQVDMGTTASINALAVTESLMVAVGSEGMIRSSGGSLSFSACSSGTAAGLYGVSAARNGVVAVGGQTEPFTLREKGVVLFSSDGFSWSLVDTTSRYLYAVQWMDNEFLAVGGGRTYHTSPDGRTWTAREMRPAGDSVAIANLLALVWTGSEAAILGKENGGESFLLTSSDRRAWKSDRIKAGKHLGGLAWNGLRYLAVGTKSILISPAIGAGRHPGFAGIGGRPVMKVRPDALQLA